MANKIFQITDDTPIAMMTAGQLKEYLGLNDEFMKKLESINHVPEDKPNYVYGVAGIRSLFHCSYPTAHALKETIIKPAVKQQGRVIIVDADLAIKLFKDHEQVKSVQGQKTKKKE